jgi:hypothetical protein
VDITQGWQRRLFWVGNAQQEEAWGACLGVVVQVLLRLLLYLLWVGGVVLSIHTMIIHMWPYPEKQKHQACMR